MEVEKTTGTSLGMKVILVLSWIIFCGVAFEAGVITFNAVHALFVNPVDTGYYWRLVDLSGLYKWDRGYFFIESFLMSLVAIARAVMFYLIIKILHDKKLNLTRPFNKEVERFIFKIAYLALLIGYFSWQGGKFAKLFVTKGVIMPDIESLRLGGADVWLFMGVTLLVIGQIFKRGTEIQTENELTV